MEWFVECVDCTVPIQLPSISTGGWRYEWFFLCFSCFFFLFCYGHSLSLAVRHPLRRPMPQENTYRPYSRTIQLGISIPFMTRRTCSCFYAVAFFPPRLNRCRLAAERLDIDIYIYTHWLFHWFKCHRNASGYQFSAAGHCFWWPTHADT